MQVISVAKICILLSLEMQIKQITSRMINICFMLLVIKQVALLEVTYLYMNIYTFLCMERVKVEIVALLQFLINSLYSLGSIKFMNSSKS